MSPGTTAELAVPLLRYTLYLPVASLPVSKAKLKVHQILCIDDGAPDPVNTTRRARYPR